MKKLLVAIAIYLYSASVLSADSNGRFIYSGIAIDSCGKFIQAVNKGNNRNLWADWNKYTYYVVGYLTGVNRYRPDTYDIKGNTDLDGIMAFIEKYCREKPLKEFWDAIVTLEIELYPNRIREAP